MRIGLLSDIHGNANALAAVLASARRHGVQRLFCTGDVVGYYYEPHKCLDLLSDWEVDFVRGNHEDMLFSMMQDPSVAQAIKTKYGSALSVALNLLTSYQLTFLANLPETKSVSVHDKRFLLCHGSPWDTNFYVYPDSSDEIFHRCILGGEDYVILGHTHYQLAVRYGGTLIINPGSVGQPRGRGRGTAHWAVLDLDTGGVTHHEVTYDSLSVVAQAAVNDPEILYLRSILESRASLK